MEDTGIIIQARLGSTRLPQKMVKPFYENKNLLTILLERLTSKLTVKIILATTTNKDDNAIAEIAKDYNVILFRGDESDVLKRFIDAAEQNKITKIIRVCADNPFIEVQYIQQLINLINQKKLDYASYTLSNNTPVIKSHIGLFAEFVSLNALKRVTSLTDNNFYHEHVTNYIYENNTLFNVELIDVPDFIKSRTDLRFTLDTPNDFELLQKLYIYYLNNNKDLKHLISFVDSSPEILADMATEINKNTK